MRPREVTRRAAGRSHPCRHCQEFVAPGGACPNCGSLSPHALAVQVPVLGSSRVCLPLIALGALSAALVEGYPPVQTALLGSTVGMVLGGVAGFGRGVQLESAQREPSLLVWAGVAAIHALMGAVSGLLAGALVGAFLAPVLGATAGGLLGWILDRHQLNRSARGSWRERASACDSARQQAELGRGEAGRLSASLDPDRRRALLVGFDRTIEALAEDRRQLARERLHGRLGLIAAEIELVEDSAGCDALRRRLDGAEECSDRERASLSAAPEEGTEGLDELRSAIEARRLCLLGQRLGTALRGEHGDTRRAVEEQFAWLRAETEVLQGQAAAPEAGARERS